ncbi:hypothetical protein AB0B31_23180 [Catellatospora citrea]|uniref:hypothetical protein n=1 Tax=Catellatospora citrea TaxID=53366 RepID=UPI0033F7FC79
MKRIFAGRASAKSFGIAGAIVAAAAAGALLAPTAASAAAWNPISGETWSTGGKWFLSSTQRYKSGTGDMQVKFSRLPTYKDGSPDGIYFQATKLDGSCLPNSCWSVLIGDETTKRIGASIPHATVFKNAFARWHTSQDGGSHTFVGEEYY